VSVLDTIVEHRTACVRARFSSLSGMERTTLLHCHREPRPREELALLRDRDEVSVVAEVKKASPSEGRSPRGALRRCRRSGMAAGGAAALSVLTEPEYFGGSFVDLAEAVDAVRLPVLCKDIVVDPVQLYMACANGADAVLLMVSVLGVARESTSSLRGSSVSIRSWRWRTTRSWMRRGRARPRWSR